MVLLCCEIHPYFMGSNNVLSFLSHFPLYEYSMTCLHIFPLMGIRGCFQCETFTNSPVINILVCISW